MGALSDIMQARVSPMNDLIVGLTLNRSMASILYSFSPLVIHAPNKLVFPTMVRPVSMLCLPSSLVSGK